VAGIDLRSLEKFRDTKGSEPLGGQGIKKGPGFYKGGSHTLDDGNLLHLCMYRQVTLAS